MLFSFYMLLDTDIPAFLVQTARHFEELQIEVENLLWNHRKLEARFSLAIKERKVLESILSELEEEHDKAIVKIEHLEKQVRF